MELTYTQIKSNMKFMVENINARTRIETYVMEYSVRKGSKKGGIPAFITIKMVNKIPIGGKKEKTTWICKDEPYERMWDWMRLVYEGTSVAFNKGKAEGITFATKQIHANIQRAWDPFYEERD